MPEIYLIAVILLFILAISDLVVGVSNDAVNFLNSSIGSQVATRHTIMIVASLGIFLGATFSSGMMEVARKGVFNPEFFFFGEIMIIFLAVMITDIILLDFFNTIGLPTSTTVSIVFELLGAAIMMSIIKVIIDDGNLLTIGQYINGSQALLIISGIFLSVVFAFALGAIAQYASRLIFTFKSEKAKAWVLHVWSGVSLTAMTYFLILKGLKGSSFASDSINAFVDQNLVGLILSSTVVWTVLVYIFSKIGLHPLRLVVLFGTFALAMAFAGNDLVNFIGVPIAGLESFLAWQSSDAEAMAFSMEILKEPVRTNSLLLIGAGVIMIVTLCFPKRHDP